PVPARVPYPTLFRSRVIWRVLNAYARRLGRIVAPSYRKRRGHPVLIDKAFWPALLALGPDGAPRDVVRANADAVHHVVVDTDWVDRKSTRLNSSHVK